LVNVVKETAIVPVVVIGPPVRPMLVLTVVTVPDVVLKPVAALLGRKKVEAVVMKMVEVIVTWIDEELIVAPVRI
jgi:hypothetical protein